MNACDVDGPIRLDGGDLHCGDRFPRLALNVGDSEPERNNGVTTAVVHDLMPPSISLDVETSVVAPPVAGERLDRGTGATAADKQTAPKE